MHHKECLCFPMIFFYYYYLFIYTLLACFLPFLFSFLFPPPPSSRPFSASYHPLHPWRLHFNPVGSLGKKQRAGWQAGAGGTISMPDTRRNAASAATPQPARRIRPQLLHHPNI